MYVKNEIDVVTALRRLELKVDAMRLEFKAIQHPRKHTMDEMLALVEIIQKNLLGSARRG